mmetsp:Transcript_29690/g.56587  ORF Transcript_29690/g.56587 Transcript_29690/m.56587 type:complete len:323 (+) Transcript_29690:239-1207(+)
MDARLKTNIFGPLITILLIIHHHHHHHHRANTTTLALRVLSIAPRILEIPKFLSPVEVQHLLDLATGPSVSMEPSTVSSSGDVSVRGATKPDARSSTGGWIHREHDVVVDAVFRRAADLMGVEEELFRDGAARDDDDDGDREDEHPNRLPTNHRIVEAMQLLRYGPGEEYAAHHDFVYPSVNNRYQPRRFATMLLYLTGEGDFLDERGVRRRFSSSADSSSNSSSSSSSSSAAASKSSFPPRLELDLEIETSPRSNSPSSSADVEVEFENSPTSISPHSYAPSICSSSCSSETSATSATPSPSIHSVPISTTEDGDSPRRTR